MKKTTIIIASLLFLCFLCGSASALTITNVKIAGTPIPDNNGNLYDDVLISRDAYENNPTVSFDVIWDTKNAITIPPYSPSDPRIRYHAFIDIGTKFIYNKKNIMLGRETGTFETVTSEFLSYPDPWRSPYVTYKYRKGDNYALSIPLTPGKTSYSYTLQNYEALCFDAHRYSLNIDAQGRLAPTKYYDPVYDAKWDYSSGGYSDDGGYTMFQNYWLAQEFIAKQTYDLDTITLKLFKKGTLPVGYSLTISIRSSVNGEDLSAYWVSTVEANTFTSNQNGDYYSFTMPKVRLTQGDKYFIYVKPTNIGDNANCIGWRKDTGSYGYPHYSLGVAGPWYYLYSGLGTSYNLYASTMMFTTSGFSITPSYRTGELIYHNLKGTPSPCYHFQFNSYGGNRYATGSSTDPYNKWVGSYLYSKINNVNTTGIFIGNMNPPHMELQASYAVGKGATFDTASITRKCERHHKYSEEFDVRCIHDNIVPLTWVLCDKDRKIIDFGNAQSWLPILDTYFFKANDATYPNFKLNIQSAGTDSIEYKQAYYLFLGLSTKTYNTSNTYMTFDETVKKTNWSISKLAKGGIASPDDTQNVNFMGAYIYFETQQGYVDTYTKGTFRRTESWATNFIIWCTNDPPTGIGLPWMPVLFGFLPAILIVGILYSYMRKWQISLPSYLYTIAGIGGLYIGWQIGLLALWVFITISVSLVFVSIYAFREPISTALSTVSTVKMGTTLGRMGEKEMRAEMMAKRQRLFSQRKKDMGVMVEPRYEHTYTYTPKVKDRSIKALNKIKKVEDRSIKALNKIKKVEDRSIEALNKTKELTAKGWTIEPGKTVNGKRTLIVTDPTNTVTREIDLGNGHKVKAKIKRKRR